ncbi:InlB B-repeat-containing protein [bacterium]|nr:InlB B-repeat-containing protein [bacterium]
MKKIVFKIISFSLIIALSIFLSSCSKKTELSFEVNGGNSIAAVIIDKNTEYDLPTPSREGYLFSGWYLSSDFTGENITKVTITKNTTVYAKWEKLYEINLNLNGGSLSTTKLYGRLGENVSNLVKDLVPTKTDEIFGAWFNGNSELSNSVKLGENGITLTAKYKVKYTVNIYKENLTHDGYTKEEVIDYAYPGRTVSYTNDLEGYHETEKEDSINEIVVSENKAENILTLYFDRDFYTVTFRSNYPNSTKENETETINLYYGEEVDLPDFNFEIEGYYLLGFATSTTSELLYDAHYIDNLPINKEEESTTKDKISANRTMSLYAIWNKGYKDMFGGSDYIFISPDNKTAYLSREGVYFVGEYFDSDKSFIFYNDRENLEGMIYEDGTYAYYNVSRDEYSAVLYTVGSGLDETIKVLFDPYNGITYYDGNEEPGNRESRGTYTIDENEFYHITFTEGPKAGETMIIIVGRVTADYVTTDAFQLRKQEEYELGTLTRFVVSNSEIASYPNAYQLTLSGFGTLTYNNGYNTETYYYSYDPEIKLLTINSTLGVNFGIVKVMTYEGINGYMFYDETLDQTFTSLDGSTLTLDGVSIATYEKDGVKKQGYYNVKESVFGGYIVSFKDGANEYTFLTQSKTEEQVIDSSSGEGGTESITTYSFIVKPNGYNEFYYKDETTIYYAPLVVINDTEEGKANVYGFTTNRTFELVLEGTYTYDENTSLYVFTTTKTHNKKVLTTPKDLKTVNSFVFAVNSTLTSYSINYWYSETTGSTTTNFKKEYTGSGNSSLVLVNGIAILSKDGYVITGTYSTHDGVTTITSEYSSAYVEIDDDHNTFITLEHAPYNAYVVLRDGSYSSKEYVSFDGKGNAKYIYFEDDVEKSYSGTVSDTNETTRQGNKIYRFTSIDKTFLYLLDNGMQSFVLPYHEDYSGSYNSDYGILYLDGYLNYASYTNSLGDEFTGHYFITNDNEIKMSIDGLDRYFDISSRSFTLRGEEFGTYIITNNQGSTLKYLELDGYGKAKVFKFSDSDEKVYVDNNANYAKSSTKYTITYKDGSADITLDGYLGFFKDSGNIYDAFVIERTDAVHTYINSRDWSILKLDSKGHAVRVDNKGNKDEGIYTIITDDLLYFENFDETYANIYKYNSTNSTIVESRFVPRGYYTEDLKSLLFSQYGFAIFNFNTKYYYNVTNDGVIIYRQDPENPQANKYGFVEENFGSFDDVKMYNGDKYYQNDGFAITFTREEATKDLYPVLVIRNPETRKPIENLTFSPTGNDTFNASGTVSVYGFQLNCNVIREYVDDHYEMYVLVGYYRFDINVKFNGKAPDGSSTSTYEVTGMSLNKEVSSYAYLNNYYMYYYFYGQSFVSTYENNIGTITLKQEFNSEGELTDDYLDIDFREDSKAYDLNGNIIVCHHASYTDSESGQYIVEIPGEDGYNYRLYYISQNFPAFNTDAYIIYALTRVETLEYEDYELTIERVIVSDYNIPQGAYFNAILKIEDTEYTSTESFELDRILNYAVREYDENDIITKTTYYKFEFVTEDSETLADGVVVPYESVTITKVDVSTYYNAEKTSFVDILDSKIVFISVEGSKYLVSEQQYNSETNTYSLILSNLAEYEVKMEDNGTVTITEIVEIIEEEETPSEEE